MNTLFYVAISNMDMGIAVSIEFLGPLSVAVTTGKSWRERVGIGIAAVGVVLLAGISLANPSGNGTFLYGLIAILIGGSMWGMYIITGRRVAAGGNSLDNLCIAVTIGWLVQSLFLGVPAVAHVVHPKADATWALEPGGSLKLLALLFVISLMASFIPCGGADHAATHHIRRIFGNAIHQSRHGGGRGTGVRRDSQRW